MLVMYAAGVGAAGVLQVTFVARDRERRPARNPRIRRVANRTDPFLQKIHVSEGSRVHSRHRTRQ